MKSVVMRDLSDYVRKYWGCSLAASMAAMLICFGYLVFCGNIRIDTEELINHPGSSLGWLCDRTVGAGVAQAPSGAWNTSGYKKRDTVLPVFFWLGANLLTFGIYERSGKKKKPVLDFPAPLCDVQHLVLSDLFFPAAGGSGVCNAAVD